MRIVAASEGSVEGQVGIEAEAGDAPVAGFELYQHFGKPGIAGGTCDQTDVGGTVEDLLAFLLGDAADDGEDFAFAAFLKMLQPVENLLLGFITDRAGVIENVIGLFGGLDLGVALVEERADHLFGIVRVHLAAEGFDVERFFHLFLIVAAYRLKTGFR